MVFNGEEDQNPGIHDYSSRELDNKNGKLYRRRALAGGDNLQEEWINPRRIFKDGDQELILSPKIDIHVMKQDGVFAPNQKCAKVKNDSNQMVDQKVIKLDLFRYK